MVFVFVSVNDSNIDW